MSKAKEYKVGKEQAELEFDAWCEAADIDNDTSLMDEKDAESFEKCRAQVIRETMRGNLTFNDDQEAVYTPHRPKSKCKDPLTFCERGGEHMLEMDKKGADADVRKTMAVVASQCGVPIETITGLVGTDYTLTMAISALLGG